MQNLQERPTAGHRAGRPNSWRRALAGVSAAIGFLSALMSGQPPAMAQGGGGLAIELNKLEDVDGSCVASLLFQNNLGTALDRFNIDLFLFDADGVIVRRVTIDMAPLPNGKTRVAQFHLLSGGCDTLGRVLVNDIPQCRAESGEAIDCLAGLTVSSRSTVELAK